MKEGKIYKKMYMSLFNAVTDALEIMDDDPEIAKLKLMAAQLDCEQIYVHADPELRKKQKKEREKYGRLVSFF